MSTATRGGRGRGRGRGRGGAGGGPPRKHRIAGQEMSWDYDPELDVKSEPQETFPSMGEDFPRPSLPMRQEVQVARHFRNIRDRLHRGPLHTVLSDKARIGKDRQSKLTKEFDPFSDMPTYSQRYKQAQHDLPRFNTRIYPIKYFPRELRAVVEPSRTRGTLARESRMDLEKLDEKLDQRIQEEEERQEDDQRAEKEKADEEPAEPTEPRQHNKDEEPEEAEPDPDENFEEDEDEMAGDYNAEAYFSGGEGDGDDVGMEDDGGGADFD